ncbi:MAG: SOS response-associated peptidase [Acidimicrobiales bacterium]
MCGRYTSTSATADLARIFEVENDDIRTEQLPLRYNVAPTQDVYAVAVRRPKEEGETPRRLLGAYRWGLIPYWAKDPSVGNRMINARAEGIEDKSAYKRPLLRHRCIIPADAFYEWQVLSPTVDDTGKGRGGGGRGERGGRAANGRRTNGGRAANKLPYVIRHRDGSPLAFAGLWEFWRPPDDPDADPIRSCVIITTEANELVAPIHDRMPVVLPPSAWERWLDPANQDLAAIKAMLVPSPATDLEAYPVSNRVNDVANEGPELLEALPPPPEGSELQLAPEVYQLRLAEDLEAG